jgi:hypothetical protein
VALWFVLGGFIGTSTASFTVSTGEFVVQRIVGCRQWFTPAAAIAASKDAVICPHLLGCVVLYTSVNALFLWRVFVCWSFGFRNPLFCNY